MSAGPRVFAFTLLVVSVVAGALAPASAKPAGPPTYVYVGTEPGPKKDGKGIYVFRLQTENLDVSQNITLVPLGLAAETPSPTYLELDPRRRVLFAVNEVDRPAGTLSAFSTDGEGGKLSLLNQKPSQGTSPCHLALDHDRRNVLVANCGSGSLAAFPVGADGRLGDASSVVQQGASAGKGSHAHCAAFDPAGRFAFSCDLASDRIHIYAFAQGKLTPARTAFVPLKAGAGPGHLAFRPDGRFAYVVGEQSSTITVFAYDAATGALSEVQTTSTVPEYYDGPNNAAEVAVHPSGKWVYVSNRGHNSVVLFNVDAAKGTLSYVEEQGTGGKKPRAFGIQPSAKHMAIANEDSGTVLASRIDAGNGRLKPSGVFAQVPSPTCVKFLPPPEER
jgi:6-phosphogluconolactonase